MLDILSATEASIVPDTPNTNDSESTNVLFQYDLYYEANLETAQTYDNRWLTNAMSCYRTYKEIYFVINPSSVHYVKMLSPSYGKKSERNPRITTESIKHQFVETRLSQPIIKYKLCELILLRKILLFCSFFRKVIKVSLQ